MATKQNITSSLTITLLILAGEAVFILPFVLQRIFRPTFLETFAINNTEIGSCFSVYGIVALFSYLFGGPLADKFRPHILMSVALILTACGGFLLATYPSLSILHVLYGFWGFTTIFLFWAAMIKATRIWGGADKQGIAFGFLDGGRGLVAALFGSAGVYVFSLFITKDIELTSLLERQVAFKQVIIYTSTAISIIGVLVFFGLKNLKIEQPVSYLSKENPEPPKSKLSYANFKKVMEYHAVWLLMIIILCAYFGYKMTDIFSLYANEMMLYNDIASAEIGTYLLYMRPVIGVIIGLLADRTRATLWIVVGFILMLLTSLVFASGIINEGTYLLFIISIGSMAIGVYSVRVLYFAVLDEAKIPLAITGTAIGFISVVGYTPDIFAGPLIGYLLDANPGALGFHLTFLLMAIFCIIGLIAAYALWKYNKSKHI